MVEGKPPTREELENKGALSDDETRQLSGLMLQEGLMQALQTWREKMRVWDLSPQVLQGIVTGELIHAAINFEG